MDFLNQNNLINLARQWISDDSLVNCEISTNTNGEGTTGSTTFLKLKNQSGKNYRLFLKYNTNPFLKVLYEKEVHFYETIVPELLKFQEVQGVKNRSFNIPKYYGSVLRDDIQVLALEDLSFEGYQMYNKVEPLSRGQIELVLKEYAKFHATGLALQIKNPETFEILSKSSDRFFEEIDPNSILTLCKSFGQSFKTTAELLADDLDEEILEKWRKFGDEIVPLLASVGRGVKVFLHSDCWSTNYMFKQKDLIILDWQLTRTGNLCFDLANLLFCCISQEDIQDLPEILNFYHHHFQNFLETLQVDPEVYPKEMFLMEWKMNSKIGIGKVPVTMQVCYLDKTSIDDMKERGATNGFNMYNIGKSNEDGLRKRLIPIVKYIVENELI